MMKLPGGFSRHCWDVRLSRRLRRSTRSIAPSRSNSSGHCRKTTSIRSSDFCQCSDNSSLTGNKASTRGSMPSIINWSSVRASSAAKRRAEPVSGLLSGLLLCWINRARMNCRRNGSIAGGIGSPAASSKTSPTVSSRSVSPIVTKRGSKIP